MIRAVLVLVLKLYKKVISPFLAPACRFYPSCSQYAIDALEKYGVCKGLWLTAVRLLKCQPLHPGGYDPVR
jgi:putative membrane protein insertion efficiency factor